MNTRDEQCEREAPLKRALDLWLADLSERDLASEFVQFGVEAEAFGLPFREAGEPKTRVELEAEEEWAGPFSVGMLVCAVLGLWYLPVGTVLGLIQIGLLLAPWLRGSG